MRNSRFVVIALIACTQAALAAEPKETEEQRQDRLFDLSIGISDAAADCAGLYYAHSATLKDAPALQKMAFARGIQAQMISQHTRKAAHSIVGRPQRTEQQLIDYIQTVIAASTERYKLASAAEDVKFLDETSADCRKLMDAVAKQLNVSLDLILESLNKSTPAPKK